MSTRADGPGAPDVADQAAEDSQRPGGVEFVVSDIRPAHALVTVEVD